MHTRTHWDRKKPWIPRTMSPKTVAGALAGSPAAPAAGSGASDNKNRYAMKTAITSTGETPDSKLDQRFGRCAWFIIYDRETGATEAVANPGREALEGAGPAAVQLVASKGVRQIVSGEFGIKIKSLVDSLGIQMIILKESEKTVREVMDLLKNQ